MSDLEQQASTWVPPWQRLSPEPEPARSFLDEIDDLDDIDEDDDIDEGGDTPQMSTLDDPDETIAPPGAVATTAAGAVAQGGAAQGMAGQDAPAADGAGQRVAAQGTPARGEARGEAHGEAGAAQAKDGLSPDLAAAVAARLGAAPAQRSTEDSAQEGEEDGIPDLAAAAGAMLAHSLAEMDAAAQAKAVKLADERAARKGRQKNAPKQQEAAPEPEPEPESRLALEPLLEVPEEQLVPVLEAILMVVDEPVSEITLAQVLDVPAETIGGVLIDLSARYSAEGRGFDLRRAAGGWRFYTRAEYSSYVERFVLDGQQLRLTQASLETLAVVAYKQPVTRSRVSAIRGVNCDGVIRTLVTRGMIEECGTESETGAHLYRTTSLFLEKMGLDSVAQLPPLAPFLPDNLEELAASE